MSNFGGFKDQKIKKTPTAKEIDIISHTSFVPILYKVLRYLLIFSPWVRALFAPSLGRFYRITTKLSHTQSVFG